MADEERIVVIGGGHAGAQACVALAASGLGPRTDLVCEEPELPYQRPPLSKTFLKNPDEPIQLHRVEAWYREAGITLHRADPAVRIDRAARLVELKSGATLRYRHVVLATGTRARRLPHLPAGLENVAVIRTAADAVALRQRLAGISRLTVIGGGFIGLEVAATARGLGKAVDVLEAAPRLLLRSTSAALSEHVLQTHRAAGIEVRVGVAVGDFVIHGFRLRSLAVDGTPQDVDTVLLGIGAAPEHALATQAGLHCDNGIVVDARMRTSDPDILAIGDCASFPAPGGGRHVRLESVQNANDQAKVAVATLTGASTPYDPTPWFWSDQGSLRLQMAGLLPAEATCHRRPGATPATFSLLHYAGGRLACVESVNAPLDHMAARKLLEARANPDPQAACDPARPLKSFL
ncbi:MAG TPA: FAD-dependent oxidoreductase [Burkholderiaceae bacterium]|nr:FAD-dependent oxidoreductase [Burkholderiaceae bacterium]